MRSVLLLLLAVPCAIAIECYTGVGNGAAGIYGTEFCGNTDFCLKQDVGYVITKGCGYGLCYQPGCDYSRGICCCYGDFCNSATGTSLVITAFAAAAAALWNLF
ncbi:hypothetical protein PRIPAC_81768 [Pristionchus pacificus]|uniref:Uncharacterized protein n=1 Tax=Pristionchus pacificus TaxID=54126 RepID=A0A454Y4K5_PRIPA|nr:hypothetical protein PRIPAC_81768 [Pristionchus pacificus]|eukprot:PDM70398.1 hypothetical protein PRIPAC_46644 [Pristionchus pacificus]